LNTFIDTENMLSFFEDDIMYFIISWPLQDELLSKNWLLVCLFHR